MNSSRRTPLELESDVIRTALEKQLGIVSHPHRPPGEGFSGVFAWIFEAPPRDRKAAAAAFDLLSRPEQARHAQISKATRRDTFLFGRAALRIILAECVDRAPNSVPITSEPGEKPSLETGFPDFNVSHTGRWVALALSSSSRIGVDIELRAEKPDALRLARRFFDSAEADALNGIPASESSYEFLRVWTAKEALLKAVGGAIPTDLSLTRLTVRPGLPLTPLESGSHLSEISGFPELVGHLALRN